MVFSIEEAMYGLNHRCLGITRVILRRDSSYFLKRFSKLGAQATIVTDEQGQPKRCASCGYVIISLSFPGGWSAETCSATGLQLIVSSSKIPNWLDGFVSYDRSGLVEFAEDLKLEDQSVSIGYLPGTSRE